MIWHIKVEDLLGIHKWDWGPFFVLLTDSLKRSKVRLILFTFFSNVLFMTARDVWHQTSQVGQHILRYVSKFRRYKRDKFCY